MTKRTWDSERDPTDAPVWYSSEEAAAWAAGYNAAVQANIDALDAAFAREVATGNYPASQVRKPIPPESPQRT